MGFVLTLTNLSYPSGYRIVRMYSTKFGIATEAAVCNIHT